MGLSSCETPLQVRAGLDIANRIAAGDLGAVDADTRKDELGVRGRAFDQMWCVKKMVSVAERIAAAICRCGGAAFGSRCIGHALANMVGSLSGLVTRFTIRHPGSHTAMRCGNGAQSTHRHRDAGTESDRRHVERDPATSKGTRQDHARGTTVADQSATLAGTRSRRPDAHGSTMRLSWKRRARQRKARGVEREAGTSIRSSRPFRRWPTRRTCSH